MGKYVEFQHLIRNFNWHSPSWDLFIILFWIVASILYAFAAGRGRLLSILVSIYMAKLLVLEAPFLQDLVNAKLNIVTASLQTLAAFGVLFVILFFFLSKYGFRTAAEGRNGATLLFGIPFAILQVGLLINIVLSFIPPQAQQTLHPLIQFLFVQSGASFVWLLAPVAYLIIFGRFITHRSET
jgi:uncharacterized membrane protein